MAARRTPNALFIGVKSVTSFAKQQVRQSRTSSLCYKGIRCVSLAANARQQLVFKESYSPEIHLSSIGVTKECNNMEDMSRNHFLDPLQAGVMQRAKIQSTDSSKEIQSHDGQLSGNLWNVNLFKPYTQQARTRRRSIRALRRYPWGSEHQLKEFDYESIKRDDRLLLDWLLTIETKGCALLKSVPKKEDAGQEMINRLGIARQSYFRSQSPTSTSTNTSLDIACTDSLMGMPNENERSSEIVFIHCVERHGDTGGECFISDGLLAAEILRKEHPEAFEILSCTDPYFWENGYTSIRYRMEELCNIANVPRITVDRSHQVKQVAFNNAIRDSYSDYFAEEGKPYHSAMKLFSDVLYDNSIDFKMESGDMMTLDTMRCVFGREGYAEHRRTHFECSYLNWDQARVSWR